MKNFKKDLLILYLLIGISYSVLQILILNSMVFSKIDWVYYLSINCILILPFFIFQIIKFGKLGELIILNVFNFLLFWTWFEIGSFAYLKYSNANLTIKPSHLTWYDNPHFTPLNSGSLGFMGDVQPEFGRWRVPNKTDTTIRCGDNKKILLESNAFGARDYIRDYKKLDNFVVLGDSFLEGYLLNSEDRLSNLLESYTSVPHLNFTINQANPLQYSLIYKSMVKNIVNHDAVIVGIFPANDFVTFKNKQDFRFFNFPTFRPYTEINPKTGKAEIEYTLPKISYSIESFSYHKDSTHMKLARKYIREKYSLFERILLELNTNSYLIRTLGIFAERLSAKNFYENYVSNFSKNLSQSKETLDFENGIKGIVDLAGGKKVFFLLIPDIHDINYYRKGNEKKNILAKEIKRTLPQDNIIVIDLLPYFSQLKQPHKSFIECDGHWNEQGNKQAFDYLIKNLDYQKEIKGLKQELNN
jgi:hypothetical protein